MGGWREEWETTRYEAPLGEVGDMLRVRIRAERGDVVRYTVQWEAWIEDRVYPVMRYDTAHGRAHRDTLDWHGEVVDKRWDDPDIGLDLALKNAIAEVRANWSAFRRAFTGRKR